MLFISLFLLVALTNLQSCLSFMSLTASRTDGLGGKGATLTPKSGSYDNVSCCGTEGCCEIPKAFYLLLLCPLSPLPISSCLYIGGYFYAWFR